LPFIISCFSVAAVVLPAIGFAIGLGATSLIPGCYCNEGSGCNGCGFDGVVEFLVFGGFIGALMSAMFVLPTGLLLALVLRIFTKGNRENA
jgi:hypothetical protein